MTAKEILDFLQSLQSSGQDLSQVEVEFHYSFGCEGTTYEESKYVTEIKFYEPTKLIVLNDLLL